MDASLIEQQLDKFNVWEEGAEFVHMRKVKVKQFPDLLDHLAENYRDSGTCILKHFNYIGWWLCCVMCALYVNMRVYAREPRIKV